MEDNIVGDYELFEMIGKGTFASVWVGCHRKTNCPVAVKQFSKHDITSPDSLPTMQREIMILKMLDHPFIADLYDVVETDKYIFLIMEYVEEGTLLEFVNKDGPIDEGQSRQIFAEIIAALNYLHNEKRIVHRDLKAENVLLDRNNNIRIIDFGLSNILNQNTSCLNTVCGSPAYVAPEMLLDKPYTQAADIWSAGVLLFAMNASYLPFEDKNITRLIQKVLNDEPMYPETFSANLTDILKKMLTKDPNQRITLEGIRQHPWFISDGFGSLFNYDFTVLDKYKLCPDPNSFVANSDIVEKLMSFGVDIENLETLISTGQMTELTAAYRSLLRDENTNIMEDLKNEMITKATDRTMSFSSTLLQKRVPLKDLAPLTNATDTHINGKNQVCAMPRSAPIQITGCGNVRSGSMPTINKVPSRGPNGMQLINLIAPTISGQNETLKMRSVNRPQVFLYSSPISKK